MLFTNYELLIIRDLLSRELRVISSCGICSGDYSNSVSSALFLVKAILFDSGRFTIDFSREELERSYSDYLSRKSI